MKRIICALLALVIIGTVALMPSEMIIDSFYISTEAVSSKLPAPTDLKARSGENCVILSWKRVNGADGYRVYIYDNKDKKYKVYGDVDITSCTVSKLKVNKKYYFKVAAKSDDKTGYRSVGVKAKPSAVTVHKWINAYKKVLQSDEQALMCSLYDITGDGIPELIISHDWSHFAPVMIYSYCDGNANKIKCYFNSGEYETHTDKENYDFGTWGVIYYYPSLGVCNSHAGSMIGLFNTVFRINGDTAEVVFFSFDKQIENDQSHEYYINDKYVSKENYIKSVSKYSDSEYIVLGNTYYVDRKRAEKDILYDKNIICIDDVFEDIEKNGFKNPAIPLANKEDSKKFFGIYD